MTIQRAMSAAAHAAKSEHINEYVKKFALAPSVESAEDVIILSNMGRIANDADKAVLAAARAYLIHTGRRPVHGTMDIEFWAEEAEFWARWHWPRSRRSCC